jgi:hypothetical protein
MPSGSAVPATVLSHLIPPNALTAARSSLQMTSLMSYGIG